MRAKLILSLAALLLTGCTRTSIDIGGTAPDFSVKDETGKAVKLSDFRGNLVLLNFWATWCKPCQEEAADLNALNQKFRDRKFRMMAVSVDTEWDVVREFNGRYQVDMPTYLDPGQQAARRYKVDKFPETFILDRNGAILKHFWTPPQGWTKFMATLDELIKEQETALLQNKG